MIDAAHQVVTSLLTDHRDQLECLAQALLKARRSTRWMRMRQPGCL